MPDSDNIKEVRDAERQSQGWRLQTFVRDRWRDRSGISGLSEAVGVSRATLYSWFNGATSPDTSQLALLADALGSTPEELIAAMAGTDTPQTIEDRRQYATERQTRVEKRQSWEPRVAQVGYASLAVPRSPIPRSRRSPRLVDLFRDQVVDTCQAGDPIGPVARRMFDRNFSQVPVYDGEQFIGLLTTDTISRWQVGAPAPSDWESVPVREVLPFAEEPGSYELLGPNATAADAVASFDGALKSGRPLDAILVTSTGGRSGDPRAIVTRADSTVLGPQ